MIYPMKVDRLPHGWWTHPAFDEMAGEREALPMSEVQAWLDQHRLEMRTVLFDEYEIDGDPPALEDWELEPPGNEWFLLAVGESEDGHFQHWARHKAPLDAIAAERLRQVEQEGWTPEHDDSHAGGDLAKAAAAYAMSASSDANHAAAQRLAENKLAPTMWPWCSSWWKPASRRRDLIKAGALIVAELERLDRMEGQQL